ncbi:PIN-like domain-containing protein [Streptomyces sp. V3I8]|uniref:PIN-like domain-containing protein n=1 Tax=Streptomyces sp. V3I8 TaxID=3042279 RepID=UPI0027D80BC8|nr:PIN-like domain-containing protein [Streptomyces sp. V3I8]
MHNYRISVDTNVLLELYRFTPKSRDELLSVLYLLKDRLWVTHQVASEYYARRISAVKDHLGLYKTTSAALEAHERKVLQEVNTFAKRCSLSGEERNKLTAPISKAFADVRAEIEMHRDTFDLSLETVVNSDPILARLGEIFDERTGSGFEDGEASQLVTEFQRRAADGVPPGYMDAAKPENAHGDFFIWEQLLRDCKEGSHSVLFITNDTKEDWVRKESDLIVGARPELLSEFRKRCNADFMVTQLGRFLQIAKRELGAAISESTVAEAENPPLRVGAEDIYRYEIPESQYIEMVSTLREYIDMTPEEVAEQSLARQRRHWRIIDDVERIVNHITKNPRLSGNDVILHMPLGDWQLAYSMVQDKRKRQFGRDARDDFAAPHEVSQAWLHLSALEDEIKTLRNRRASLSVMKEREDGSSQVHLAELDRHIHTLEEKLDRAIYRMRNEQLSANQREGK